MLGLIEIKRRTPKGINQTGGFLYIKFKAENNADVDLLMNVFWEYMNATFCGFSEEREPKFVEDMKVVLNKEQTIYYDYQKCSITIN